MVGVILQKNTGWICIACPRTDLGEQREIFHLQGTTVEPGCDPDHHTFIFVHPLSKLLYRFLKRLVWSIYSGGHLYFWNGNPIKIEVSLSLIFQVIQLTWQIFPVLVLSRDLTQWIELKCVLWIPEVYSMKKVHLLGYKTLSDFFEDL